MGRVTEASRQFCDNVVHVWAILTIFHELTYEILDIRSLLIDKLNNNVFKLYQRGTSGIDAQCPIEKPMQRCADDSHMADLSQEGCD
jgi:hypothetical protein